MKKELIQLTDRIYFLPNDPETDRPILSAICGDHQTLLIDTGNSKDHAELFLNELNKYELANNHAAVLTHWHWDHSFGSGRMGMFLIAHEKTKSYLKDMCTYEWTDEALDRRVENGIESPFCANMIKKELGVNRNVDLILPNLTFQDELEVYLGGIHCIIKHVGGDHSIDSTIIFAKEEKVLFLGDCLYPSIYTNQPQYTPACVQAVLQKIDLFDADTFVLSHQEPMTKEEFHRYNQLLKLICNITEKQKTDYKALVNELHDKLGRKLNQLEEEIIHCFINGMNENK